MVFQSQELDLGKSIQMACKETLQRRYFMIDISLRKVLCANQFALRLWFIALFFLITGCSNPIEKCVQAFIKVGEPYETQEARDNQEVRARPICLKSASGLSKGPNLFD
jgi:hypothetical protein